MWWATLIELWMWNQPCLSSETPLNHDAFPPSPLLDSICSQKLDCWDYQTISIFSKCLHLLWYRGTAATMRGMEVCPPPPAHCVLPPAHCALHPLPTLQSIPCHCKVLGRVCVELGFCVCGMFCRMLHNWKIQFPSQLAWVLPWVWFCNLCPLLNMFRSSMILNSLPHYLINLCHVWNLQCHPLMLILKTCILSFWPIWSRAYCSCFSFQRTTFWVSLPIPGFLSSNSLISVLFFVFPFFAFSGSHWLSPF